MTELVSLEGVSMVFRALAGLLRTVPVRAVDGVSLSLAIGETVALVGESGSGKTTLGRISLGLLKPTSGRVVFDGVEITAVKESRLKWFRRRAQEIFQDPYSSLDPYMNVTQILEEPLVIHSVGDRGERRQRMQEVLQEMKLVPTEEFAGKYPHMLSGGQRQRVGIGRALTLRPDYIVADEPVSMIDASGRAELLYLLRELQETHNLTFLYITHDVATARHFSHRTAVMYLGRIVEMGLTGYVIQEPLHPYTKVLIEAVPTPDPANRTKERRVTPGEPPSPVHIPSGCRFHPRCPSFMPGKCDVVDPSLREIRPGHFAACHLYE